MTGLLLAPLQLGGLIGLRVFAIVRVQPAWRAAFGPAYLPIAAVLAVVVALTALPRWSVASELSLTEWGTAAMIEIVFGTVLGHVFALVGHVVLGNAAAGATVLRVSVGPWSALVIALCGAAALGLGLHRPLVAGLADLAVLAPPGDPMALVSAGAVVTDRLVAVLVAATVVALSLATPVLLPAIAVELTAAALGRGPGAVALFAPALAPLVRMAAVLVALAGAWSIALARWAEAMSGATG